MFVAMWVAAVVMGQTAMSRYATTAGKPAALVGNALPELLYGANQPAVVLFVHPNCPCSAASVQELAAVLHGKESLATVIVVFQGYTGRIDPAGTKLWQQTAQIPGVVRLIDQDGAMARRFGAKTSGQVLAYGSNGKLLFAGGITPARGESGSCAGIVAITQVIGGVEQKHPATPVYGCAL